MFKLSLNKYHAASLIAAPFLLLSLGANAQPGLQPGAKITLPTGTISPTTPKPDLSVVKTQPNWSVSTLTPNGAANNPVEAGDTARITLTVINTRDGTLTRPIRLVMGNKAHGNYRDFGTFRLDKKGRKRTFQASLKVPNSAKPNWYQTTARLLEANGQPLADHNTKNTSSVNIAIVEPKPDSVPTKVAGASYDWSADPQACKTTAGFIADAWTYMPTVLGAACAGVNVASDPRKADDLGKTYRQCVDTVSKYTGAVSTGVSEFNKLVGKSSWATLGPRDLRYGIDAQGTVIFPGDRTFVSVLPARTDTLKLRMRELDGKAKVEVVVCAKGQSGNIQRLNRSFGFNYSARSTNQLPRQDESMLIGGVRDKFVTVILKTRGNPSLDIDVGRKLQYILNVSEDQ